MKLNIQNVRGTQDFFGENIDKYNYIIKIVKQNIEKWNFKEIATPIIELSELFERNLGDTSDVVSKEIYKFEDRSGNMLALRPEFTAGVIRSFVNNGELNQNLPQKLFSYGPNFRYDRPQKGRYRQLHQVSCEYIGYGSYLEDVEILSLAYNILKDIGLNNITLEINSLGSERCKNEYSIKLKNYLNEFKSKLSEDSKNRLEKNPLRILDSKDENDKQLLKNIPLIEECYSNEEKEFFNNILKALDTLNIDYVVNPLLVRGLDYYTATVFEFTTKDLGAQSTVLGGGRYNNLIEQLGGKPTPSVGFGGGIERMMLLLKEIKKEKKPLYSIIPIDQSTNNFCYQLVNYLRNSGYNVDFIFEGKFKNKLEKMNKIHSDFAIIVGEDEIKSGKLKVKNLSNGEEKLFLDLYEKKLEFLL